MTALGTLGWVLVHSVWQAAVIAGGVALFFRLGRAPARVRYAVGYGALVFLVIVPALTALVLTHPGGGAIGGLVPGVAPEERVGAYASSAQEFAFALHAVIAPSTSWLALAWLVTVAVLLVRWGGGWWLVARLAGDGTRPARPTWESALATAAVRTGTAWPVRLLESARVDAPTVVGHLRPAVLLPVPAFEALEPAEVESVLAHELAHVRRGDFLANGAQTFVEVLFFFHPAVRWLSRMVREEREMCCDDVAVQAVRSRVVYARALARLEAVRSSLGGRRLALAANGGSLLRRIERLADSAGESGRASTPSRLVATLAGVATLVALVAVGRLVVPATAHAIATDASRAAVSSLPERYTVRAHDPAGEFSITFERGRPTQATVGGVAVPRERLVMRGDSLFLPWRRGAGHFAVRLQRAGFTWSPRQPSTPAHSP